MTRSSTAVWAAEAIPSGDNYTKVLFAAAAMLAALQGAHEPDLAGRGKGGLGLVQEEETGALEAPFEVGQEPLPV